MQQNNIKIRLAAMEAGVPMWRMAQRLGIAPETLSKKLRYELSIDEEKRIFQAIEDIKEELSKRDGNT